MKVDSGSIHLDDLPVALTQCTQVEGFERHQKEKIDTRNQMEHLTCL
jgi:hypothetical protein